MLDLAPSGVYLANVVTNAAVRSYRTLSPLPSRAVCFCSTFRKFTLPRRYLALYSMEPGLSSGFHQQLSSQHDTYYCSKKFANYLVIQLR